MMAHSYSKSHTFWYVQKVNAIALPGQWPVIHLDISFGELVKMVFACQNYSVANISEANIAIKSLSEKNDLSWTSFLPTAHQALHFVARPWAAQTMFASIPTRQHVLVPRGINPSMWIEWFQDSEFQKPPFVNFSVNLKPSTWTKVSDYDALTRSLEWAGETSLLDVVVSARSALSKEIYTWQEQELSKARRQISDDFEVWWHQENGVVEIVDGGKPETLRLPFVKEVFIVPFAPATPFSNRTYRDGWVLIS